MRKNLFIIVLIFTILISTSNSEIKNVHADGATTLPPYTTLDSCSIEGTYGIVYTPNNTAVDVFNYYDILELLPGDKTYARNYAESVFPNLVFLAEATKNYNCHSYAWYSQSVNTNEYCMGNPSAYYASILFIPVYLPGFFFALFQRLHYKV